MFSNNSPPSRKQRHSSHHLLGKTSSLQNILAQQPAKSRMLWREGFTTQEIENSRMGEQEVKRQEVIFEIIHTEADYVKDLRIMVDILLTPMGQLKVTTPEQTDLIFGNIREILELHEQINTVFMERQRKEYPVVSDISDVLLPYVHRFRIYAKYICNQDNALRLVEELKRTSNHFNVFWKERQRRPECRGLSIESFLVMPFQRLLKYPLFLQTLLAATDENSPQYRSGRGVAEQVDAWIKKIQDARTKLDSYNCLDALSKCVVGVDWQPLLLGEHHKLVHMGQVKTTTPHFGAGRGSQGVVSLANEEGTEATMWLFEEFLLIARPEAPSNASRAGILPRTSFSSSSKSILETTQSAMSTSETRYVPVVGPCQAVEMLELASCSRGAAPSIYLHMVPYQPPGASCQPAAEKTSVVVHFASRANFATWRSKLDAHVRQILEKQPASVSADLLADAIARATIKDSEEPLAQCIGRVRSPPASLLSSAQPSSNEIPTISVREVYVQFPAPQRQKGKIRRGWDFLCSKTEDITGQGIKRQLKKYGGGGGGKRRAVDEMTPSSSVSSLEQKNQQILKRQLSRAQHQHQHHYNLRRRMAPKKPAANPPIPPLGKSPSFVHIPETEVPVAANGGKETSRAIDKNRPPQRISSLGISHPQQMQKSSRESVVLQSHKGYSYQQPTPEGKLEYGSATLTYGSSGGEDGCSMEIVSPVGTSFPSTSSLSQSTLLSATTQNTSPVKVLSKGAAGLRPKPLPIPPALRQTSTKPVFEFGSAKLTYGDHHNRTWNGGTAHEAISQMPGFGTSEYWHASSNTLAATTRQHASQLRGWQAMEEPPGSANSTDSFCIVEHGDTKDEVKSRFSVVGARYFE